MAIVKTDKYWCVDDKNVYKTMNASQIAPYNPGYSFEAWNTLPDGSGTSYGGN